MDVVGTVNSRLKASLILKRAQYVIMKERLQRGIPESKLIYHLRPKQIEATLASVKKHFSGRNDVLAVLPTGYGKTLLFNLIPMYCSMTMGSVAEEISLVIAPLNALIDQHLQTLGWNATKMTPGKFTHIIYLAQFHILLMFMIMILVDNLSLTLSPGLIIIMSLFATITATLQGM
jgi:superfamily II DNA or RNA helicase